MKFGMFVNPQQPRSEDPVKRFLEVVEQARLAKEAGFDAPAAGHHYLSPPYQSLQSLPLLARLAGEAPGMELCLSVYAEPGASRRGRGQSRHHVRRPCRVRHWHRLPRCRIRGLRHDLARRVPRMLMARVGPASGARALAVGLGQEAEQRSGRPVFSP